MENYKAVYMYGQNWTWETIEAAEKEIEIASRKAETLMIADVMKNVLAEVKTAYRAANNPKTDGPEVAWKL